MKKQYALGLFTLALLAACGDEGGNSAVGPENSNTGGSRVDPVLIGTWIPLTEYTDTLFISETEYRSGTMAVSGSSQTGVSFYARNGQIGQESAGFSNVLFEYVLQKDTLHVEFQNLAVGEPDGVVVPGANAVRSYTRAVE